MLRTIGYEFDRGRWVARWEFIYRTWIDLRYPQYNTRSSGRFIEPSYVFAPADRGPYLQASSADVIAGKKLVKTALGYETIPKFFLQVHDEVFFDKTKDLPMDTITTLSIRILAEHAKQTAVFEDHIQQAENESDADFLKRAAIALEALRHRAK